MWTFYSMHDNEKVKRKKFIVKPSFKKWHYDKLLDAVRKEILSKKEDGEKYITREEIARVLKAKPHTVEQCLHVLHLEGLVSNPVHHAPHDSKRDSFSWGNDNSWCGDTYYIF